MKNIPLWLTYGLYGALIVGAVGIALSFAGQFLFQSTVNTQGTLGTLFSFPPRLGDVIFIVLIGFIIGAVTGYKKR